MLSAYKKRGNHKLKVLIGSPISLPLKGTNRDWLTLIIDVLGQGDQCEQALKDLPVCLP